MEEVDKLIEDLKLGIKSKNKQMILDSYNKLQEVDWDNQPNSLFEEYDNLIFEANDILYR